LNPGHPNSRSDRIKVYVGAWKCLLMIIMEFKICPGPKIVGHGGTI